MCYFLKYHYCLSDGCYQTSLSIYRKYTLRQMDFSLTHQKSKFCIENHDNMDI